MPLHVAYALDSYRSNSEDRAGAFPIPSGYLLVIADGVGGRPYGGATAQFVLQAVADLSATWSWKSPPDLSTFMKNLDRDVSKRSDLGETTAVVCAVTEQSIVGASIGDSVAWWTEQRQWHRLTEGASPKPWLGSGAAKSVPFAAEFAEGWLILMTDGVWKYSDPDTLLSIVATTELNNLPSALIDAARLPTSKLQDDTAVIAVKKESGK